MRGVLILVLGAVVGVAIGLGLRPSAPAPSPPVADRGPAPPRGEAAPHRAEAPPAAPPAVEPGPRADAEEPREPADRGRLAEAVRLALRAADPAREIRGVLSRLAGERETPGGADWILADAEAAVLALGAALEGAGLVLDNSQRAALAEAARAAAGRMAAARDAATPTERRAARRAAEAWLEGAVVDLLHSDQPGRLDEALDGRAVTALLPGGDDDDTLSSTGAGRERVEAMVLGSYRRRLALPEDPPAGLRGAVAAYVDRVDGLNRELAERYGRGFVEALDSGPTPHSEAARRAREEEGYALREQEGRARLWALQAELERALESYLDEEQARRLRETRPQGLRFTVD